MKKLFNLFIVAVFAVSAAACTKDGEIGSNDYGSVADETQMSFVIKGFNRSSTTYARIASETEDYIDDLSIYMFDNADTGKLLKVFENVNMEASGYDLVIMLGSLKASDYPDVSKFAFYFVGNRIGIKSLDDIDPETITHAEFCDLASNIITDPLTDGIATPLQFFGSYVASQLQGSGTVELARTVARFDVVNNIADQLEITDISIKGARTYGPLFPNKVTSAWSDDDISVIENAYSLGGLDMTDYKDIEGENIACSVFYLNPTKIPSITTITIKAVYDGVERVYHVGVKANQTITWNYRYKLVAPSTPDANFRLVRLDWNSKNINMEEPRLNIINLQQTVGTGGYINVDSPEYFDIVTPENATITFDVTPMSELGAPRYKIKATNDDSNNWPTGLFVNVSKIGDVTGPTYATGATYRQQYTVKVNSSGMATTAIADVSIIIMDEMNQNVTATLRIKTPVERRFAKSNIVWDAAGQKLTFAGDKNGTIAVPANSQGVMFKWGSLIPVKVSSSFGVLYNPNPYSEVDNPTGVNASTYNNIPHYNERTSAPFSDIMKYEFADFGNGKNYDESKGIGDICRFISDKDWVEGDWRLPTAQEYMDLYGKPYTRVGSFSSVGVGNVSPNGTTGLTSACIFGTNVTDATTEIVNPENDAIVLPATGTKSGSSILYINNSGYYLTSTLYDYYGSSYYFADFYFSKNSMNIAYGIGSKTSSMVRCVRVK